MTKKATIDRLSAVFRQAAVNRLMHEDGCPEGEQIRAGVEAVLSALRPGDVLPDDSTVNAAVLFAATQAQSSGTPQRAVSAIVRETMQKLGTLPKPPKGGE